MKNVLNQQYQISLIEKHARELKIWNLFNSIFQHLIKNYKNNLKITIRDNQTS